MKKRECTCGQDIIVDGMGEVAGNDTAEVMKLIKRMGASTAWTRELSKLLLDQAGARRSGQVGCMYSLNAVSGIDPQTQSLLKGSDTCR